MLETGLTEEQLSELQQKISEQLDGLGVKEPEHRLACLVAVAYEDGRTHGVTAMRLGSWALKFFHTLTKGG